MYWHSILMATVTLALGIAILYLSYAKPDKISTYIYYIIGGFLVFAGITHLITSIQNN